MNDYMATVCSDYLDIDSTVAILRLLPEPTRILAQLTKRPNPIQEPRIRNLAYPRSYETRESFIDAVQERFSGIELITAFYRLPEDLDEAFESYVSLDLYRVTDTNFSPEGIADHAKRMVACISHTGQNPLDERYFDLSRIVIENLPLGKIKVVNRVLDIREMQSKLKDEKVSIHPHYIGFSHTYEGARKTIPTCDFLKMVPHLKKELCQER